MDAKEATLVFPIDERRRKILPPINIYLDDGRAFREKEITLEMIVENKTPKVAIDSSVKAYFEELVKILEREEEALFPSKAA